MTFSFELFLLPSHHIAARIPPPPPAEATPFHYKSAVTANTCSLR